MIEVRNLDTCLWVNLLENDRGGKLWNFSTFLEYSLRILGGFTQSNSKVVFLRLQKGALALV